jgi:trans-L-3-hydroxyproline dehydratase
MDQQYPKILQNLNWQLPTNGLRIKTIEMHTGGEPLRVFIEGLPEIKGDSILEKQKFFRENYDYIRTGTMFEPRGHADMYGAILTDPCSDDADFGVFFIHNEGYSSMCGHAIIALTKLVLETGMIQKETEFPILQIDAPPGRIVASARFIDGKVDQISFLNVPSFLYLENMEVQVDGIGKVSFDIAFGGAYYAFCDADALALKLEPSDYSKLIDYGRRIKIAIMNQFEINHPFHRELGFLYGTIFTGAAHQAGHYSRNVCIFADGELDRSPTGSGVSARAGLHFAKGEMDLNREYIIESILGTTMRVNIVKETNYGSYDAVIPKVSGTAFITGRNEFYFDPDDPLKQGFIFR